MKVFIALFLLFAILHCQHNAYGAKKIWKERVRFAKKHEFGYVVSIGLKSDYYVIRIPDHICTGVLITKKHVLTSAHCLNEVNNLKDVRVKLGFNYLNDATKYKIKSWITYELWTKDNNIISEQAENDISILKLAQEVNPSITIPAVIADGKNGDFYGTEATTVVWAPKKEDRSPKYLKAATLDVISYDDCIKELKETRFVSTNVTVEPSYLCTHLNLGAVLENIDSGGPLLNSKNELIAINDPTYLQRNGIHVPNNLNFHVGIDYYRNFITNVTQTKDAKWWQIVRHL